MKKATTMILALALSFCLGYAVNSMVSANVTEAPSLKRVTGIGGIFFKCKDPKKLKEWYNTHLGLKTDKYGTNFVWWQGADSSKKGYTQWSPFKETTTYFEPSKKDFMINYRVENLTALIEQFKKEGVTMTDTMQVVDYGKFIHILDLEGNKVELWEPVDSVYGRFEGGQTK
jgi:predicted enzyme related to lactoylglutathione lyase